MPARWPGRAEISTPGGNQCAHHPPGGESWAAAGPPAAAAAAAEPATNRFALPLSSVSHKSLVRTKLGSRAPAVIGSRCHRLMLALCDGSQTRANRAPQRAGSSKARRRRTHRSCAWGTRGAGAWCCCWMDGCRCSRDAGLAARCGAGRPAGCGGGGDHGRVSIVRKRSRRVDRVS